MGRRWLLVLGLFVFSLSALLGACCADQRRPVVFHAAPLVRLKLHGDTNFTQLERTLVEQAARDLVVQTGGWFDVRVDWDFDMAGSVSELTDGHTIVRRESFDLIVLMVEAQRGSGVLGITVPEKFQTWLVVDRLQTPEKFRHVVMHELLHQAGLDDLRHGRQHESIMYWATTDGTPNTCMTREDAVEFCRVLDCDHERMNYCAR